MPPNRIAKGFSDRFPKHFPSHFPLVKPTDSPAPKLTPLIELMLVFQDAQKHTLHFESATETLFLKEKTTNGFKSDMLYPSFAKLNFHFETLHLKPPKDDIE